ncbi:2'-5' RNA ligase family protein [Paracraurococcus ruber]|uniref:Phosphoesterase HXTX n=2 Tax=Paracraurococcus ruber TaxID=77675 RepID=A0ABS1CTL5_9PROT|nr:2'-5' RNA ligase family protein [Paracraurococcus ruber]MBK1657730.1 phosphoesterase HXTX [Paracraurococcus ruber]TDG31560.1 2'-5' RNA ligase family protein [Paracraurococcus ruber]
MPGPTAAPLILTLALDAASQSWLEELRRAHFPPARNLVPAHVTLFHALPGEEVVAILAALAAECTALPPSRVRVGPPRSLGRGVALEIGAPAIARLRDRLAARWRPWLTAQDRQRWQPHATVQNKVSPEAARALLVALSAMLPPREARAEAVLLWRYRGGPWERVARIPFTAGAYPREVIL